MNKVILNEYGLTRIERGIAPPMKAAITLPVNDSGVVVYVCIGQFGPGATINELCTVAETLVLALKTYNKEPQS